MGAGGFPVELRSRKQNQQLFVRLANLANKLEHRSAPGARIVKELVKRSQLKASMYLAPRDR